MIVLGVLTSDVNAGRYDELAARGKRDSADYARLIADMNKAQNAHEVALAMKENVRRQRETGNVLLRLVRAHRELRDAGQLGLSEQDQLSWRRQHPDRISLPPEVSAIGERMDRDMDAVNKAGNRMVDQLRKYLGNPEVRGASNELERANAENSRRLLAAMQ